MRRLAVALSALVVTAASLASCGDDDVAVDEPVVRIFAPYRGAEADLFMAGLEDWADAEGIDIRYTGSADFVSDLEYQVFEVLSPPDIALVPQPGVVEEMFREGRVVAVPETAEVLISQNYDDEALDLGRFDGTLVGFPYRANVKSLVWYRPGILTDLGLAIPGTMNELRALVEEIEALGLAPWCLGIEAQRATGWPGTDWVEDLILRRAGADVYADWVNGVVPFRDERIADAFAEFRALVLQPGRVAGGVSAVLSTNTQASDDPLFTDPIGCVLFKQASFAYGWMPPGLELGPEGDIDFFVLPAVEPGVTPPVVAGADLAVAFNDRPEVTAVLARLATPEAGQPWAEGGSYVSPRSSVDSASYYQPVDRAIVDVILEAETLTFDGSDSMPAEIGTDLFWRGITAWISGQITYDQLAATLDQARQN